MNVSEKGYKPNFVCELLGISTQTFRYWREHLMPLPKRAIYSGRDLFAFRLMVVFVREKNINVQVIEQFPISKIFEFCNEASFSKLKKHILALDLADLTVHFYDNPEKLDVRNRTLTWVFLDDLVEEHLTAMFNFS